MTHNIFGYKIMNRLCVDFIVSLPWNICLQKKLSWIVLTHLLRMTIKRMTKEYISI